RGTHGPVEGPQPRTGGRVDPAVGGGAVAEQGGHWRSFRRGSGRSGPVGPRPRRSTARRRTEAARRLAATSAGRAVRGVRRRRKEVGAGPPGSGRPLGTTSGGSEAA